MLENVDGKMIALAAASSLTAYVFYGHINLVARVDTIQTKQEQVISEQRDLWGKYNKDLEQKVNFMQEYYGNRLEDEKRWTYYWKEKAEHK